MDDKDLSEGRVGRRELLLVLASSFCVGAVLGRAVAGSTPQPQVDVLSESLPGWPQSSRLILRNSLLKPDGGGRIASVDVRALAQAQGLTVEELMTEILPVARHFSRPPISKFRVGAVALGASGSLYPGANLEIPGSPLNQAVHAEQSALANAFSHRERGIVAISVTAAPCGHCRQFLNEVSGGSKIRVIVKDQPIRTLEELLPASFGPQDLGMTAAMFNNAVASIRLRSGTGDALARAALDAASRSYAPHTKALAGCAVKTKSGRTYAGSYLENAAYNPSLSPMQSALVSLVLGGEDLGSIRRVVLVEMRGAAVSQRATTEMVLAALAPSARLEVLLAEQ